MAVSSDAIFSMPGVKFPPSKKIDTVLYNFQNLCKIDHKFCTTFLLSFPSLFLHSIPIIVCPKDGNFLSLTRNFHPTKKWTIFSTISKMCAGSTVVCEQLLIYLLALSSCHYLSQWWQWHFSCLAQNFQTKKEHKYLAISKMCAGLTVSCARLFFYLFLHSTHALFLSFFMNIDELWHILISLDL